MNRTTSRDHTRVTSAVEEIATRNDIPVPEVVLSRRAGPLARSDGPERFTIVYRRSWARRESDLELRGTLGHELAHVEYQDAYRVPRAELAREAGRLVGIVVVVGVLLAALTMAAAVWAVGLGAKPTSVSSLGNFVLTVSVMCSMILLMSRQHRRWLKKEESRGRDRPFLELRADLRAVQLVGRDAAMASIRRRIRGWRCWHSRLDAWLSRYMGATHPPDAVRLAALLAYDPVANPAATATSWLQPDLPIQQGVGVIDDS